MPTRSSESVVTTSVGLPNGDSFALVLPAGGDDPVVGHYRDGRQVNDYLVNCLHTVLPRPGVVLDLGCHVGTFSVAAAALGHRVLAVDASARHVDLVTQSAAANGLTDRLSVIERAVSDTVGTARYRELGLFGTIDPGEGSTDSVEVRADSVPRVLAEAGLTVADVDLVKMDIEGSELRAISGMSRELAGDRTPMLLYESNPLTAAWFGYTVEGLRTVLQMFGYTSYRVEGDDLYPCPVTEAQPEAWVDLLALTERHRASVSLTPKGPWGREQLLQRFDYWSQVPHANCRAYLALTLMSHWSQFGDSPLAREMLARLAEDEALDVRSAVAGFRWDDDRQTSRLAALRARAATSAAAGRRLFSRVSRGRFVA